MSKRHWKLRVEDMLNCAENIQAYLGNMNYEEFAQDQKTIDAVVRNLEIIGEASKNIPDEIKEKHNDIVWHRIEGLRNRIIHAYFDVDLKIIWRIVQDEIPDLRIQMLEILESH